jgi:hypothetical protein
MQAIVAAIDEGALPQLDHDLAARIRALPGPAEAAVWELDVDLREGQRVKAWCDARRERTVDQEPSDTWTRIVARVNEAVQPLAAADPLARVEQQRKKGDGHAKIQHASIVRHSLRLPRRWR